MFQVLHTGLSTTNNKGVRNDNVVDSVQVIYAKNHKGVGVRRDSVKHVVLPLIRKMMLSVSIPCLCGSLTHSSPRSTQCLLCPRYMDPWLNWVTHRHSMTYCLTRVDIRFIMLCCIVIVGYDYDYCKIMNRMFITRLNDVTHSRTGFKNLVTTSLRTTYRTSSMMISKNQWSSSKVPVV